MIIDFEISNFGPFKDPMSLTFEADKDTHLASSYVRTLTLENGNTIQLLRMALLYGPNAAGKTTILKALRLLDELVINPARDSEEELDINVFKFSSELAPTTFKIKFVRTGMVYRYAIEVTRQGILCETLEHQSTSQNSKRFIKVFQRRRGDIENPFFINFGRDFKLNTAELDKLNTELLPNTTMLSVLNRKMTIKNKKIEQAYLWFKFQLMSEVIPNTKLTKWASRQINDDIIEKPHILRLLNQAGIPIKDINFTEKEIEPGFQKFLQTISDESEKQRLSNIYKNDKDISTVYTINNKEYALNLNTDESLGTQRYYGLAALLAILCRSNNSNQTNPIENDCLILPIDEIEHSLHPDLLEHFIITFLKADNNSQLIATTHYRELLLNNLLFRNDVIWFVDKDPNTMASDLYCLQDVGTKVGLRATSSVYNFVKQGRLGAVPQLGD